MITAFKKRLSGGGRGSPSSDVVDAASAHHASPNAGIHSMSTALQRKFCKGVNYNMKVLIRGDRSTGKSTLFRRLQGEVFNESYIPTDEIAVAAIQWNHKATDDIVKVEVWDVVDRGKKRVKLDGLKISQEPSPSDAKAAAAAAAAEAVLDAEFLDVYKGAHGVIFVFDVTKAWTFEYVRRELPKVPAHIPVLVMGNFMDQAHHRVVTRYEAASFVERVNAGEAAEDVGGNAAIGEKRDVRYAEASMRNGFGLRFLHKFLSLPYLALQQQSLRQQLAINETEVTAIRMELDVYLQSEESSYESFQSGLTNRRRQEAESVGPSPTLEGVVVGQQQTLGQRSPVPPPHRDEKPQAHAVTNGSNTSPNGNQDIKPAAQPDNAKAAVCTAGAPRSGSDLDSFVPEASALDSFLDDFGPTPTVQSSTAAANGVEDSDDDDVQINPMVKGFREDVDLDDLGVPKVSNGIHSDDDD